MFNYVEIKMEALFLYVTIHYFCNLLIILETKLYFNLFCIENLFGNIKLHLIEQTMW